MTETDTKPQHDFPDLVSVRERARRLMSQGEQGRTKLQNIRDFGTVSGISGMVVEVKGVAQAVTIGSTVHIIPKEAARSNTPIKAEVVGFRGDISLLMPYDELVGVGPGCRVEVSGTHLTLSPSEAWLGRVIDPMGVPLDGLGAVPLGDQAYPLVAAPLPANERARIGDKLDTGIRALNTFTTLCEGQRMGIFSGSGVGKSILMSMLARYAKSDVIVIGLVGERGREVREFIEDDLGPEGMKRTVMIVATSDRSPLMRRMAAYATMAVAESFRDQGKNVLCLMDSVTRFAMAQREIGLSVGEPPTTKGYPPTTFTELAKLLERAGPGCVGEDGRAFGTMTGLFTVLVEGDDDNEPVSDTVRGILDGHIVLDREIANRGRYPAINILRSVSRAMPKCNSAEENALVMQARKTLSSYEDMAELIRLGAYRKGSNPDVDRAIELYPQIEDFLSQTPYEHETLAACYQQLANVVGVEWGEPQAAADATDDKASE